MLIQQIIRKQTISILDKILQPQKQSKTKKDHTLKNQDQKFTIDQFVASYHQKGSIKDDEKQILMIFIQKYVESTRKDKNIHENTIRYTQRETFSILRQIKQQIIEQQRPEQKRIKKERKQISQTQQQKNELQQQISKKSLQNLQVNQPVALVNPNQIVSNIQPMIKQQQISNLSKKLKNQFIMRNIDRIKKYGTQVNDTSIDYQKSQLQETKISHEISHKLFHLYRSIYPTGITSKEMANFQTKERYKTTLNYHKIMEMFNDSSVKLEIDTKLSLLRLIKKFAFNQNLVQYDEWTKIYRAIINNLGVKEVTLQRLVKLKEEEKKSSKFVMPTHNEQKQSTNKKSQLQYRTRRIKTEASTPQSRFVSMSNIITEVIQPQSFTKVDYSTNKSGIRPIEALQKYQSYKTSNPNQYRSKHKRLLKDVSEVMIKNMKKNLRSEKMIGIQKDKPLNSSDIKENDGLQGNNQYSYLKKAIKAKKISNITWESLFEMNQDTMHHNIVIPKFARDIQDD